MIRVNRVITGTAFASIVLAALSHAAFAGDCRNPQYFNNNINSCGRQGVKATDFIQNSNSAYDLPVYAPGAANIIRQRRIQEEQYYQQPYNNGSYLIPAPNTGQATVYQDHSSGGSFGLTGVIQTGTGSVLIPRLEVNTQTQEGGSANVPIYQPPCTGEVANLNNRRVCITPIP
jgi:hypothetical protein